MPAHSMQLYSFRNFDLADTLQTLADLGLREVEGFGALYEDPSKTKALLDTYGLSMTTGHFEIDLVENEPENALNIAREFGMEAVIIAFLKPERRPTDRAGWAAFGAHLETIGAPIRAAGLQFGWHNHDFEFLPLEDGTYPIEAILEAAPSLVLELDLAWVAVAGGSPVEWIERYKNRIISAHIKDHAPKGENLDEGGWADVGHGVLDWDKISTCLRATGIGRYVLEHDNPKDGVRFATRSYEKLITF